MNFRIRHKERYLKTVWTGIYDTSSGRVVDNENKTEYESVDHFCMEHYKISYGKPQWKRWMARQSDWNECFIEIEPSLWILFTNLENHMLKKRVEELSRDVKYVLRILRKELNLPEVEDETETVNVDETETVNVEERETVNAEETETVNAEETETVKEEETETVKEENVDTKDINNETEEHIEIEVKEDTEIELEDVKNDENNENILESSIELDNNDNINEKAEKKKPGRKKKNK
jgi:hypothetical protein